MPDSEKWDFDKHCPVPCLGPEWWEKNKELIGYGPFGYSQDKLREYLKCAHAQAKEQEVESGEPMERFMLYRVDMGETD